MPKLRTKAQNSLMWGLAKKIGVTHDDLSEMAFDVSRGRTEHTSELYQPEMVKLIDRLEEFANPKKDKTPRRTTNYRKQKTGVETIVTPEHLDKLNREWARIPGRTPSGLESLTFRIIKADRPRTTKECNKVIEAVKSMNAREKTFGEFQKQEAA